MFCPLNTVTASVPNTYIVENSKRYIPYRQIKGLYFGLLWVVIIVADKGQIMSRLSVFQYLNRLRGLQEWTDLLYRFIKININILSENTEAL